MSNTTKKNPSIIYHMSPNEFFLSTAGNSAERPVDDVLTFDPILMLIDPMDQNEWIYLKKTGHQMGKLFFDHQKVEFWSPKMSCCGLITKKGVNWSPKTVN